MHNTSFTKASKLYVACQHHKQPGDHLLPFAQGPIFATLGQKAFSYAVQHSYLIYSWCNTRSPPLLQLTLSRYSETSMRKCAAMILASQAIDLISFRR